MKLHRTATRVTLLSIGMLLVSRFFASPLRSMDQPHDDERMETQQRQPKIFILAGQSNMVGFGSSEHMMQLIHSSSNNNNKYQHLWNNKTGNWTVLDRVKVDSINLKRPAQPLTMGQGQDTTRFGPELGFGWNLAKAYPHDDILLIKTAWSAKSLAIEFRPPSAGLGNYPNYKGDPRPAYRYGEYYRAMMDRIQSSLHNASASSASITGFVWFQGWNDHAEDRAKHYASNLIHFLHDIQRDLNRSNLPIVVGETGQWTKYPAKRQQLDTIRQAQENVTLLPDFKHHSLFCPTAHHVNVSRPESWSQQFHFSGHADTMYDIGSAFGDCMIRLLEQQGTRFKKA